jgi:hypothetical protein
LARSHCIEQSDLGGDCPRGTGVEHERT